MEKLIDRKITTIVIPSTVKEITAYSFGKLSNLKNVSFPSSVTKIGDSIFAECTSLETFQMPEQLKIVYKSMFAYCTSLKKVTLSKGTTEISHNAFIGCSSLTSVNLPSTLTTIGDSAFKGTALTSVTIPDSVTSMDAAFRDCTKLTYVKLPAGITSLRSYTFNGCTSLKNLLIPANVKYFGSGIGYMCEDCPNLTTVYFMGNPSFLGMVTKTIGQLTIYSPSSSDNVREHCKKHGIKWKSLNAPKLTTKKRTTSAVTLEWGKVAGAAGYKVYKKTNSGKYTLVKTTTATSFKDTGLKKGVTYRYYVVTLLKDADGVKLESIPSKVFKTKV